MENNELNNKILKNVRNRIVVSNLEKEEAMKISKRKQIFSLCTVVLILFSGSFCAVNAATEGKLIEDIKEKYKEFIIIDYDQSKYEMTDIEEGELPTGQKTVTYTFMSDDNTEQIDTVINVDNLDTEKLKITLKDTEEDVNKIIIEDK